MHNSTNKVLKETIYSPESGITRPVKLFKEIIEGWAGSWSLGWRLFLRNFKGMYRQSLLGLTWAIIPPILTTAVWVFLNSQKILNIDTPNVPYPAFVLTSTLLWSLFAQSMIFPINSMNSGKSMMKKLNFPKESLLLSGLFQIGFDFLVKAGLIIVVFIVFGVTPGVSLFLAPVGILMLVLMGFCIGLLLMPIGMLYNDVQRFLGAILPFWMLLTPVVYPNPRSGFATILNKFNPVSPILSTTRDWIFNADALFLKEFYIISAIIFLLLIIGNVAFRLVMPMIIERSGG